MGDVLHALPAVAALRAALPAAHLAWAIDPRWQPLLRDSLGHTPLVDTIHSRRHQGSGSSIRSPFATLASIRSAAIRSPGRPLRSLRRPPGLPPLRRHRPPRPRTPDFVGPASPRETPARLLYRRRVPVTATNVVDQAAQLLSAALNIDLQPSPVTLPEDPAAEAWWQQHPASQQPFVFLVPQAGWGAKQWPAERFGAAPSSSQHAGYRMSSSTNSTRQIHSPPPSSPPRTAPPPPSQPTSRNSSPSPAAPPSSSPATPARSTSPRHSAGPSWRYSAPPTPPVPAPSAPASRVLRHPSSVTDHSRHQATERGLLQITTQTVVDAAFDLLQHHAAEPRS